MLDFGYYEMDCMEGMKEFPDQYFDLAVVDPPYGGDSDDPRGAHMCGGHASRYMRRREDGHRDITTWDHAPSPEYFDELRRVSKNQIIWGGNYFSLPPTRCFIVWEKTNIPDGFTMSPVEYAWTSFSRNAEIFRFSSNSGGERFHPTQKPAALYRWIYDRFAKTGDKILDTHVGSASSLMAAYDKGLPFVGFEIDDYYYGMSKKRLDGHMAQHNLFTDFPEIL